MKPDYDILIIGGGMVGASLGVALGGSGLRVGLVEAVPFGAPRQPSYDDRTIALAYGSKKIFAALGIWDSLHTNGDRSSPAVATQKVAGGVTPISRIHISDQGHFGFAHLDSAEAGVEQLGYVVENRVLGAALTARLREFANVTLVQPAVLTEVDFSGPLATVSIELNGAPVRLSTSLVVAADGGNSAVRAAAGIAAHRVEYGQSAVVANVTTELAHESTAFERFTKYGPLALLPMEANRCSVVWSLPPPEAERMVAISEAEFLGQLQESFGTRLGRFLKTGARNVYPLALTRVKEHVRNRLVLIGNAAHTLHPVAGQGFNLGLRDVAVLAQVLVDAQRRAEDVGSPAVLQTYASWRKRDNLAVSSFTDALVRIFSNNFGPLVVARDLGLLAVDLVPAVKRALMRHTMGLAGRLPRLARGLPLL